MASRQKSNRSRPGCWAVEDLGPGMRAPRSIRPGQRGGTRGPAGRGCAGDLGLPARGRCARRGPARVATAAPAPARPHLASTRPRPRSHGRRCTRQAWWPAMRSQRRKRRHSAVTASSTQERVEPYPLNVECLEPFGGRSSRPILSASRHARSRWARALALSHPRADLRRLLSRHRGTGRPAPGTLDSGDVLPASQVRPHRLPDARHPRRPRRGEPAPRPRPQEPALRRRGPPGDYSP